MSWYNPWNVLASVRKLMWNSDHQEEKNDEEESVSSKSQDINPEDRSVVTSEYDAIRNNANDIEMALTDNCGLVIEELNTAGLLKHDTYDLVKNARGVLTPREKAGCVLTSVRDMVSLHPRHYHTFMGILGRNPLYFQDITEKLGRTCLSIPSSPPTLNSTPASLVISQYSKHLKSYYRNTQFSSGNKWPPSPSKKFVKIAIVKSGHCRDEFIGHALEGNVKKMLEKRTEISMEKILEPDEGHSKIKLILIEGAPGIGKSTLAWELCTKWEEFESMQQYKLVVLLRLRDEEVQEIRNVSDLFPSCRSKDRESLVDEVTSTCGKGVLFILDGFDELPIKYQKSGFLVHMIGGSVLPECTVLVTSRPSATSNFLTRFRPQKRIEILGFTRECVEEYAYSIFSHEPEKLNAFNFYISASNNPAIHSLMYIPLNAAIIVSLFDSGFKSGNPLPHTLTQLYAEVCFTILRRDVMAEDPFVEIREFRDLPGDLHEHFLKLAEIAFEGFLKEEVILHAVPSNLVGLGFLDTVSSLYGIGKVSHNFLHLTLQEFFAAYHISQVGDGGLNLFKEHGIDSRWNVVWRFVAGLTQFKYINNPDVLYSVGYMRNFRSEVIVHLPFVQCLYEAQISKGIHFLIGSDVSFIMDNILSPLDLYSLGYSITCSNGSNWEVHLGHTSLFDKLLMCFISGLRTNASPDTGKITKFDIYDYTFNFKELFDLYPCRAMTSLFINDCSFDCSHDDCYSTFKKIVNPSLGKLKDLTLFYSDRLSTDHLPLFPIFFNPSSLSHLSICIDNIHSVKSLSFIDLATNTNLTHVKLVSKHVSPLIPQIVEVLKCNKTLTYLTLGTFYYETSKPLTLQGSDLEYQCDPLYVMNISDALHDNRSLQEVKICLEYPDRETSPSLYIKNNYPGIAFDKRITWRYYI